MTTANRPNLKFSHMGITVKDVAKMEKFYVDLMGFTVTDRGSTAGLDVVFLSRDPNDHHQIVLASGRPDNLPANTANPMFGPCINQISFHMESLTDLKDMHRRLKGAGYKDEDMLCGNHGIGWSIYFPDPEGNVLECFVDSEWYIDQPELVPIDLSKSEEDIVAETKAMCEKSPGFEPMTAWKARIAPKMAIYRPTT